MAEQFWHNSVKHGREVSDHEDNQSGSAGEIG